MKRLILCISLVILMVCVVQSANAVVMTDVQKECQQQAITINTGAVNDATMIATMEKTREKGAAGIVFNGLNLTSGENTMMRSLGQTGAPGIECCSFNVTNDQTVKTIGRIVTS